MRGLLASSWSYSVIVLYWVLQGLKEETPPELESEGRVRRVSLRRRRSKRLLRQASYYWPPGTGGHGWHPGSSGKRLRCGLGDEAHDVRSSQSRRILYTLLGTLGLHAGITQGAVAGTGVPCEGLL